MQEKPTGFSWLMKDKAKNPGDALADGIWFSGIVMIENKQEVIPMINMNFKEALEYEYNDNLKEQREGKFAEVKWLEIGGIKGVYSVEAAEKDPTEHRKIT